MLTETGIKNFGPTLIQARWEDRTICEQFQSEGLLSLLPRQRRQPPQTFQLDSNNAHTCRQPQAASIAAAADIASYDKI